MCATISKRMCEFCGMWLIIVCSRKRVLNIEQFESDYKMNAFSELDFFVCNEFQKDL